ncbi:MAG TPA: M20/M25/M40 family metallo-hydrolase [Bacteroidales bacterium]|nr:M20/M25/M40 family metallo-hydrolase [Bacteroidales bacterium]HRW94489.1 M20/M25/M40 family metallo-hydrolase [Bacteroidales bacterium]
MKEATQLLRDLIKTPSTSGNEDKTAVLLTEYLFEKTGIRAERIGNNVVAQKGQHPDGRPTVLLCSHHDTVKPAAGYTRDPYNPVIEEDQDGKLRLYGLGSNDAGVSVVAMTEVFCSLNDLPYNLMLILAAGEENSDPAGIASVLPLYPDITCAIVGEPTGLQAAVGERGLLVLDGFAQGRSGHAARNNGINALYKALDDINALRNFTFAENSAIMGKIHLQVTQIQAGTQHNVIPGECRYVVDVRTTDACSNREIVEKLNRVVSGKLVPRNLANKASVTPESHPLRDALKKAGIPTFVSPTTSDWMRLPCPAVKIGPGDSTRSHTPDEFIYLSELQQGIDVYKKILTQLTL